MCTCLISLTGFVFLGERKRLRDLTGSLTEPYGMLTDLALLKTLTGCLRDAYGIGTLALYQAWLLTGDFWKTRKIDLLTETLRDAYGMLTGTFAAKRFPAGVRH